jgi:hypothetical protein
MQMEIVPGHKIASHNTDSTSHHILHIIQIYQGLE